MTNQNQINPFVHNLSLSTVEIIKVCLLGVVLLPIRLLIAFICIVTCGCLAMVGLAGLKPEDIDKAAFTGWRKFTRDCICYILRFMYICCGFIVRIEGEQASSKDAPILVVAPHSTFFDSLPVVLMGAPSVVAKAETTSIPFWGAIIKMTQPVLVHRSDTNSRQTTIKHISDRAEGEGWQQVLIFPEGTCTNRQCLITFRLGAFYPCVPVQPVCIRYDNALDTVTWTWEGPTAVWVIVYSLSQLYTKCSIEYLPPYVPNKEEKEDPKLFAANVRSEMAKCLNVNTTDCNYFDYLKIEKCQKMLKKVRKLQGKLDVPLLELTKDINDQVFVCEEILEKFKLVSDCEEVKVIDDLCGGFDDLRNLKLIAMIATDEDAVESFVKNIFTLYDPDLGDNTLSQASMESILQTLLFLTMKESKEFIDSTTKEEKIQKSDFQEYLLTRKPNYVKIIKCWEGGLLGVMDDLLAMSAKMTRKMELVAETGSNFLTAGKEVVSDVSATVKASKEKVTGALNSAVTSLHKRTGSRSEPEKKTD